MDAGSVVGASRAANSYTSRIHVRRVSIFRLLRTLILLLPTAYRLLPTVLLLLPTAYCLLPTAPAPAQSVSVDGGPLDEVSRPVSEGSRNVHERGRTVSEGSSGSMKSGPVRDSRTRGMVSGPVSEVSSGPVGDGRPMTGGGSQREASSGAVKNELDRSLGEQLSNPRQLQALQDSLRALRLNAGESAAPSDSEEAEMEVPMPDLEPVLDVEPGFEAGEEAELDNGEPIELEDDGLNTR